MASTAYDVQREYMVTGAKLCGKYQIPQMPICRLRSLPEDTVDFEGSLGKNLRGHNKLNVHFYIDDYKYEKVWNQPDKYIDHLRCFNSVCAPDFSVSPKMPFPICLYNKYRNHAVAWYYYLRGVNIVPAVGIYGSEFFDWCFDGYPKDSIVSVCSNGRLRNKESRAEFIEGFKVMCDRINPSRVLFIGIVPDEMDFDVPVTFFETRTQKLNKGLI